MPDHIDQTLERIADVLAAIIALAALSSASYGFVVGRGVGDTALTIGGVGLILAALIIAATHSIFGPLPYMHTHE